MKKLLVCLAVSAVLFTGCSVTNKSNAIIRVNDQVITQADFDKTLDKAIDSSFYKSFGGSKNFVKSNDNPAYLAFKGQVVNKLIVDAIIKDEIQKRGITVTKDEIQNELKDTIDKIGSKEELNRRLKQEGISNNEFMKMLETEIQYKKLIDSVQKIEVSDSEAESFYKANPQLFVREEEVRASHILVHAPVLELIQEIRTKNPDISPEELNKEVEKRIADKKTKAEAILAEVKKNPQDFEKIARQKSDDKGSAEVGGDLGYFNRKRMVKEFSDAAFSMKPDTISSVVQTQYGFHIIKVTDRVEAGIVPYAKIKDELKFSLEKQRGKQVLANLVAGAEKNVHIEYLSDEFNPAKAVKVKQETIDPSKITNQKPDKK